MTVERRVKLRVELRAAMAVLTTLGDMADVIEADRDIASLQAVRLLLERELDHVDDLLLALSADRLDDERRGDNPTD